MDNQLEFLSPQQICQDPRYPFTMGQLRGYLFNRNNNGLASAVRKISERRLVLRKDLFDAWIESHR